MNINSPEILAPAGSFESAVAAVRGGANAVYLGAKSFSARASAKNFDEQELAKAVLYCHERNVKVYLAVNTLMTDSELPEAMNMIKEACLLPIDALIVQDAGLAFSVKSACPDLRLHASTQMSVHTPGAARLLYEKGFSRVVLARELSAEQIKEITASSPIETEVFVHGALCMSVSGQCYLSSVIGKRSGNRGQCAQPCRLSFRVKGGTGCDLSLKDLSLTEHLTELAQMGVDSFKIEGRMKRPEYVYSAVSACRYALENGRLTDEMQSTLTSVFSRSGFTDGYYRDCRGKEMFGTRQKDDVTAATSKLLSNIRNKYKDERQSIGVSFSLSVKRDKKTALTASDNNGHTCTVYGETPQNALSVPVTEEKCTAQLKKTGGTQFFTEKINVDIDPGLSLSASAVNSLRRNALEKLSCLTAKREPKAFNMPTLSDGERRKRAEEKSVWAVFPDDEIPDCFKACEYVFLPLFTKKERLLQLKKSGFSLGVYVPPGMFGAEKQIEKRLSALKECGICDVLVNNIGAVASVRRLGMKMHGGFRLNITNSQSVRAAEQLGLSDVTASFELTNRQINSLSGGIRIGAAAYGYLPLMLLRCCPMKNAGMRCESCRNSKKKSGEGNSAGVFITDRTGEKFPLVCDGICTELLNCVPLSISDKLSDFSGADFFILNFTVENYVERVNIFNCFLQGAPLEKSRITRGLYYRGVI